MSLELASRYRLITSKVETLAGGPGRAVLVAVSKKQPLQAIQSLYELGHRDFGENYVQELVDKAGQLAAQGCADIRWHFIGHLQTNKVKALLPYVHSVHSIDSEKLAAELDKRWRAMRADPGTRLPCFIEVNIDRESSKSGVMPEQTAELAAAIAKRYPCLLLEGLMAIPAASEDPRRIAKSFEALRELEATCRPHTRGKLSMGMSGDYELALPLGATHVRVGTALFGARDL